MTKPKDDLVCYYYKWNIWKIILYYPFKVFIIWVACICILLLSFIPFINETFVVLLNANIDFDAQKREYLEKVYMKCETKGDVEW